MPETNYDPDPRPKPLQWIPSIGLGPSGSAEQQIYEGRDPAPPDDPSLPAISFVTGGGPMTQWVPSLQAWV